MELTDVIMKRRSTRSFTERIPTKNEVEKILTAGTMAPSACNMQSWHFYVVTKKSDREKLRGLCSDFVPEAPVVIIVCTAGDEIIARFGQRAKKFVIQDTALAMENMLLCAADMGLGGCIIGAYDQDAVTSAFNIPKEHTVVALLPIGEPAENVPARARKPLSDVVTFIGGAPTE